MNDKVGAKATCSGRSSFGYFLMKMNETSLTGWPV